MRLLLAACCVLAGCATIDSQVDGWPQDMATAVHQASPWEIQKRCWQGMPWYWKALGGVCAQVTTVNLSANTCDIYTPDGQASEHELAHCKGGDHDGTLQAYFNRYQGATNGQN